MPLTRTRFLSGKANCSALCAPWVGVNAGRQFVLHVANEERKLVNPDVTALLQVQADDLKAYGIEDRLGALLPRVAALETDLKKATEALSQAKAQVEAEEKRQRDLQDKLR